MPIPPYGSEPKPGSPEWFFWEGSDITSNLAPFAGTLSLSAMGLSTNAQNTADFCRVPPPTDLPGPLDYLGAAFPIEAVLTGVYTRLGNQVKAQKWDDLCQWKAPTVHVNPVDPPDGFTMYYLGETVTVDTTLTSGHPGQPGRVVLWANDGLPTNAVEWAVRVVSVTGIPFPPAFRNDINPLVVGQDSYLEEAASRFWATLYPTNAQIGTWVTDSCSAHTYAPSSLVVTWETSPSTVGTVVFDVAFRPDPGTPPGPPPTISPPADYPDSGGPCETVTLSDLCRALNAIQGTVDTILRKVDPPELVADPEPTPVVDDPAGPPPGGGPTPKLPVDKPPLAVGVVVTITHTPDTIARYGQSPVFYPAAGHIAMTTLLGPLPSVLIKHSPMVLTPIPSTVKTFALDLAPGVEATLTWLYPPTDPPLP